jgi:hypothetical protein
MISELNSRLFCGHAWQVYLFKQKTTFILPKAAKGGCAEQIPEDPEKAWGTRPRGKFAWRELN